MTWWVSVLDLQLLLSWLSSLFTFFFPFIWLYFMVYQSDHVVLKKSVLWFSAMTTHRALLGPAPETAVFGLGCSLGTGVSQSPQEMPGLRTTDFVSYTGQPA